MMIRDRPFWAAFQGIPTGESMIWLASFEHNYHPRIHGTIKEVMILEMSGGELDNASAT